MAKKRAYVNQKGGVCKTNTTISDMLMSRLLGRRALAVDTDSQGNMGYLLGYFPDSLEHTLYTVMMGKSTIEQAILPTYYDPKTGIFFDPRNAKKMEELGISSLEHARRGPDLLPNNILSAAIDTDLQAHPRWGDLLRAILDAVDTLYDDIGIDTNPSLGKMTVMALCGADYAVVPTVPETLPVQGMIQLCRTFIQAKSYNQQLQMAGMLFTRVKYSTHRETMKDLRGPVLERLNADKSLPGLNLSCFTGTIPESALVEAALRQRSNVLLTDPISAPSVAYWQFYTELLKHIGSSGLEKATQMYHRVSDDRQKEVEQEKVAKQQQKQAAVAGEG